MIGQTRALPSQPLAFPRSKTASGGLRSIPRHRLSRFAAQPTEALGKNRLHYDGAWQGAAKAQSSQPKVDCGTTLPNGQTIQSYVGTAISRIQATPDDPFGTGAGEFSAFVNTVKSGGLIDFKNNFRGQADARTLAAAGNFAYGAIASGIGYSQSFAQFGAGAYAFKNGKANRNNPGFEDNSAAQNLPAGYASNGCRR